MISHLHIDHVLDVVALRHGWRSSRSRRRGR
jgi:ribonuclease BN (tRNA processing enzyme)